MRQCVLLKLPPPSQLWGLDLHALSPLHGLVQGEGRTGPWGSCLATRLHPGSQEPSLHLRQDSAPAHSQFYIGLQAWGAVSGYLLKAWPCCRGSSCRDSSQGTVSRLMPIRDWQSWKEGANSIRKTGKATSELSTEWLRKLFHLRQGFLWMFSLSLHP